MPPKQSSWKDVIIERQKESFVGRKDYLKQFTDNFTSEIPNYLLFFVIGEGGVGKSTLLKQFESIGKNPEIDAIVITCDDEQSSPVAAMGYIAEQLAKFDINSKEFNERYKTYRSRRDEIESDPKAPRGALNLVVRGMTDFAIKAARRAPGVGVFAEYVDEKEAGEALTQGINYLVDRIGNKDEVQLLREPEKTLTPLFIELLNKVCEEHRIVLMFDVFERTREALEPWLLEFLDFKFGEFDTGTTFVVSGRDTVDQRWTQIASSICYITLEPFVFEETRSYLRSRKITNKQLVKQIFEDTGGLPVLVELLAGTNPKPGLPLPDISKDAVKRFLQWIPEEERRWVALLAAVPRNFNLDILSAALDSNANNDFNWLSVQSYIRTNTTRGWFYHEKVRELMLRYIHNTRPGDLSIVHKRLATFFEAQQERMRLEKKEAYSSKTWREFEIEKNYHFISEQPDRNITTSINAFLEVFRWRWGVAENILQVLQQAQREVSSRELEKIIDVLGKFYQAYNKDEYDEFITQANILSQYNNLSEIAKTALFSRRAEAYLQTKKYVNAIADFDRAVALDGNFAWAIAMRGLTNMRMDKYEQALIDFDYAVKLDENNSSIIARRGETFRELGKYEEALADFDRAIAIDKDNIWALANRGETYHQMGKYVEALADFDRSIKIDNQHHWAYERKGIVLRNLERYEEAIDSLTQAEKTGANCHTCIVERGKTYLQMGKYEQALLDFDHAIVLKENSDWAFANRGNAHRQMGSYELALADLNRAIGIDDKYIWALSTRGKTFQRMDNNEKALADYDRIIELDNQNHWAHEQRGIALSKLGRFEEAIDSLTQAKKIYAECPVCLIARGDIYRTTKKYEQALADFNAAIALDEKSDVAFERRGEVYKARGEFELAIEDFTRAISIDEKYSRALLNRGATFRSMRNYERALSDISTLINLDENNSAHWASRGDLFWEIGDLEKALADFSKTIELDKDYHWAYERKSLILRSLGRLQEALDTLSIAVEKVERCSVCISHRGEIYRRMGLYQQAILDFSLAIEIEPANISFELSRRSAIYHAMGDLVKRDDDIACVMALPSENAPIYYNKAVVCALVNKKNEAIRLLEEAIKEEPSARTYARHDDLFQPLRDSAEFQEMIRLPII